MLLIWHGQPFGGAVVTPLRGRRVRRIRGLPIPPIVSVPPLPEWLDTENDPRRIRLARLRDRAEELRAAGDMRRFQALAQRIERMIEQIEDEEEDDIAVLLLH